MFLGTASDESSLGMAAPIEPKSLSCLMCKETFLNPKKLEVHKAISHAIKNPLTKIDLNSDRAPLLGDGASSLEIVIATPTYHQFRHFSELKYEAKGRYLEGKIQVPTGDFGIKIFAVCAADVGGSGATLMHPAKFFTNRIQGKSRDRENEPKEPIPSMDLIVMGNHILWKNGTGGEWQDLCSLQWESDQNSRFLMLKDLRLTVVLPVLPELKSWLHSKRSVHSPGKTDPNEWAEIVDEQTRYFLSQEGREELHRIRLKIELFDTEDGIFDPEPKMSFFSRPISNYRNGRVGDIELLERNPEYEACSHTPKTFHLVAKRSFSSATTVEPRLVVRDASGHCYVDQNLNQPTNLEHHQQVVVFDSATQNDDYIDKLYSEGRSILIEMFRSKSGTFSSSRLPFKYITHTSPVLPNFCVMCRQNICGKGSPIQSGLQIHINQSHDDGREPCSCNFCEQRSVSKSQLERHRRVHAKERPWICDTCGRGFTRKQKMTEHCRVHSDLKEFTCITCGKQFKWKSSLERHMMDHTGRRPHPCELCKRAFKTSNYLKKHKLSVHSRIKQAYCQFCQTKFRTRSSLFRHQREQRCAALKATAATKGTAADTMDSKSLKPEYPHIESSAVFSDSRSDTIPFSLAIASSSK